MSDKSDQDHGVSSRVGRSLLKFFKPIRVALPHHINQPFKKIVDRRKQKIAAQQKQSKVVETRIPTDQQKELKAKEVAKVEPLPPEKAGNWLNLVVHLLSAVKILKSRMSRKQGLQTYADNLNAQTTQRHKTVGAILDMTQEDIDTKKKKKEVVVEEEAA